MNEYAIWREKLRQLTDRLGRGGIKVVADRIGKPPTYVSRMLSDPSTSQHRVVTHETCWLLSKEFPDWLDESRYNEPSPTSQTTNVAQTAKIYTNVRSKSGREKQIEQIHKIIEQTSDTGLSVLLFKAREILEEHPVAAKQTQK